MYEKSVVARTYPLCIVVFSHVWVQLVSVVFFLLQWVGVGLSETQWIIFCNRENCILGQGTRFMILQHPRLLAVRDEFALVRGQFHVISVLDCEQLIIDTLGPYLLPSL